MRDIPKVDNKNGNENETFDDLSTYYIKNGITPKVRVINKKYVNFDFETTLGKSDLPSSITDIEINKRAFLNNMTTVMRYINYFIEYFDDDDELLMSYFLIMFCIMKKDIKFTPDDLIFTVKNYFGTKTMIDKIANMVEYNIEEGLMKKADKKYDESLQLTTDHLKCIMGISIFHKILIPIISHYVKVRKDLMFDGETPISERQLQFKTFTCFLDAFDSKFDVSFYNKIYHTATTRVYKTSTNQKTMWLRRRRMGVTETSYINKLMKDLFIEISQKAVFSKPAIAFIHVCFDMSIKNELKQQDEYEMSDLEMDVSDPVNEEISKFDKLMMANAKVSERDMYQARAIIKDTISRMAETYDVKFNDSMMKFYRDNLILDDSQVTLIFLYFSSIVSSYEILLHVKYDDLIKMIILMKKKMASDRMIYLPHIISGVLDKTTAKRYSRNKIISSFEKHPLFDDIIDQYKWVSHQFDIGKLINDTKILISCQLSIVDFDRMDQLGKKIVINDIATMDEICHLLYGI